MDIICRRFGVLCALVLLPAFASKKPGSSAIPDRREFPVNASVSPCQDFYEYTCSSAVSGFTLREDRSKHVFSFSDSHERLLEAKKKFLQSLPDQKNLSDRARTLSTVFQACMNEKASAEEEKKKVAALKAEVEKAADRKAFEALLAKKRDEAEYTFIDWGTISNLDDSDWNDVYFLADIQTLPEKTYYDKPKVVQDLKNLARKLFESAGIDNPDERAQWVVDFEKKFAKSYPSPAEMRELFNKKTSITRQKLLKDYPTFQLGALLERLPKRTHLRHLTPENFAFVNESLSKAPLEVLKSVYLFHALSRYMDDAYPDYFRTAFEFQRSHLGGPNVRPVRSERCTMYVMNKFTKEIDAELLDVLFPAFSQKKVVDLVGKVRSAIAEGIRSNAWLSPKSKIRAAKKIQVAQLQLVKPLNDNEWDFNPPAQYSASQPYANDLLLQKNLQEKELAELAERRDRKRWEMGPLTVNAYYSPSDNKFVLPIGILQYPFYDPQLPDTSNLGAVGMVVGHELGHAIDDHGARYDERGRMIQWMGEKDVKEFVRRGQRLVSLFDEAGQNGKLTLGENIGDLVGLTFAYKAAFPGDKGTDEQKQNFFLQYARTWCGVIRPGFRERLLKTDPHALFDARVNEQVKHQKAFAQAFHCKPGDPMVLPESKRVTIW